MVRAERSTYVTNQADEHDGNAIWGYFIGGPGAEIQVINTGGPAGLNMTDLKINGAQTSPAEVG